MPTLRELQTTVMDALIRGAPEEPALALMSAGDPWARVQLRVYQNNATTNFCNSLRASFPVIAQLVGTAYFRQIAGGLQHRHPSRSGDLLWVGQHFPGYLRELHGEGEYLYLSDVARLEWLCQECWHSADDLPLDFAKLTDTVARHHDSLVFLTSPSLRFFDSRFPILRIWESNTELGREPDLIDLTSGADCLLLLRHRATLKFHRLNSAEHRFLIGLLEWRSFASIVDECLKYSNDFDAGATLRRFVAIGAIVDCRS